MATDLHQIPHTVEGDDYTPSPSDPGSDSDSNDSQLLIGESLIPIRERKHPGTTVVTIDGLLKDPLHLKEDLKDGCGGQLWPAGLLLSKYMLEEHATDLVGKTMFVILPSTHADNSDLHSF
jgi:protein N-lysine methyltransferase METTL21A